MDDGTWQSLRTLWSYRHVHVTEKDKTNYRRFDANGNHFYRVDAKCARLIPIKYQIHFAHAYDTLPSIQF